MAFQILLTEPDNELDLYTIFEVEVKKIGGFKLLQRGNSIIYQILNTKKNKQKSVILGNFPYKKWFFLYIIHEKAFLSKSSVNVGINIEEPKNFKIDYPKISDKLFLSKFHLASNFSGQISNFIFLNAKIKPDVFRKYSQRFPLGLQFKSEISIAFDILKSVKKNIILFLAPFSKGIIIFISIDEDELIYCIFTKVAFVKDPRISLDYTKNYLQPEMTTFGGINQFSILILLSGKIIISL